MDPNNYYPRQITSYDEFNPRSSQSSHADGSFDKQSQHSINAFHIFEKGQNLFLPPCSNSRVSHGAVVLEGSETKALSNQQNDVNMGQLMSPPSFPVTSFVNNDSMAKNSASQEAIMVTEEEGDYEEEDDDEQIDYDDNTAEYSPRSKGSSSKNSSKNTHSSSLLNRSRRKRNRTANSLAKFDTSFGKGQGHLVAGLDTSGGQTEEECKICRWRNCNQEFPNMQEMVAHLETEHVGWETPWTRVTTCRWAGCWRHDTFGEREKLLQHLRVHTGERPYVCPVCALSFPGRSTACSHIKRIHRKTLAPLTKYARDCVATSTNSHCTVIPSFSTHNNANLPHLQTNNISNHITNIPINYDDTNPNPLNNLNDKTLNDSNLDILAAEGLQALTDAAEISGTPTLPQFTKVNQRNTNNVNSISDIKKRRGSNVSQSSTYSTNVNIGTNSTNSNGGGNIGSSQRRKDLGIRRRNSTSSAISTKSNANVSQKGKLPTLSSLSAASTVSSRSKQSSKAAVIKQRSLLDFIRGELDQMQKYNYHVTRTLEETSNMKMRLQYLFNYQDSETRSSAPDSAFSESNNSSRELPESSIMAASISDCNIGDQNKEESIKGSMIKGFPGLETRDRLSANNDKLLIDTNSTLLRSREYNGNNSINNGSRDYQALPQYQEIICKHGKMLDNLTEDALNLSQQIRSYEDFLTEKRRWAESIFQS